MASQADKISAELKAGIETVMKKLTLDVAANLKAAPSEGGTPVDTGNARAQWTPQIGRPYRTEGLPTGGEDVSSFVNSANTRSDQGSASVATKYKLSKGSIFVSNNAPYILRLNEGYSKQAPSLFIQTAINKAVNTKYKIGTIKVAGSGR